MFFMVPEDNPDLAAAPDKVSVAGWYQGSMDFSHPDAELEVTVCTPAEVARELAANILAGEDDELSAGQVLDCYGEMINMVAGGLLTAVDQKGEWKMGLPRKQVLKAGNAAQLAAGKLHHQFLEVDGRPLVAAIARRGS